MNELLFYTSIANDTLHCLQAGRVTLAGVGVLQGKQGEAPDIVMLNSLFWPPSDSAERCIELRLGCTEWQFESWRVGALDLPSSTFRIPREAFGAASFRVLEDAEVLARTIKLLDRGFPPFFMTLRDRVQREEKSNREAVFGYWIVRAYDASEKED